MRLVKVIVRKSARVGLGGNYVPPKYYYMVALEDNKGKRIYISDTDTTACDTIERLNKITGNPSLKDLLKKARLVLCFCVSGGNL